MWKQPWGYLEGWTICAGIFITGMVLQFSSGKIDPESFRFPVNLVAGAAFLSFMFVFHLISKKNKSLTWFVSHTAAITSLVSLLFMVIIMGLTRQLPSSLDVSAESWFVRMGFMQMTVSWSFLLLSFYFLWVLGLVILRRLNYFKWKYTGFILNHAGLFVAFFAAILGSGDLQRLRLTAHLNTPEWRASNEKYEMVELPLAIELNSFTIDEYPPKLMLLDNITGEALPLKKPATVSIDTYPSTIEFLDWKLEVTDYLPFAAGVSNQDTINYVAFAGEGATSALFIKSHSLIDGTQKEGWLSSGNHLFPFASLKLNEKASLIMPDREPKRFASEITVYTQDGNTKETLIEVNKPSSVAGWKIYQLSYDDVMGKWSPYSVFELVKDPWLPLVYTGIIMLLAGSIFLFFSAPNKTI